MISRLQKSIVKLTRSDRTGWSSQMFTLITFPSPVPSANAPSIAMSSRPLPQPQQPAQPAVTAGSLT
jgi:hypothetical protein